MSDSSTSRSQNIQGANSDLSPSSPSLSSRTTSSGAGRKISQISTASSVDPFGEFEAFFGRFWTEIGLFSFDKAREIAEKEKERALKTHVQTSQNSSSGFTWVIITTALSQIAIGEKIYLNLGFLAPKGFLRKDCNLKSTLESVKLDLRKTAESSISSLPGRHSNSEIVSALLIVVNFRLEMMEFYEKLSLYDSAKNVEISDLLADVEALIEKFIGEKSNVGESISIINGVLKSLEWECQVVENLLKAINSMQVWDYLEASIAIQLANNALQEWSDLVQSSSLTARKSTYFATSPTLPSLYLWFKKLKSVLMSKFTLYFYELLAKHSNPHYDIRLYCTKLATDYYSRLTAFQKKSDVQCICLVFDAREIPFYPNGYHFPTGKPVEPLQGLDSFPSVLCVPSKPIMHWPSVVMIISDRQNELNADKCVGIYDSSVNATYFVQKLDVRMYLLIIYESKKAEKDAYTQKFMMEIAGDLKGTRIFSSLKCFKA